MHCIYGWRWTSGRTRRSRSGHTSKHPIRPPSTYWEEGQVLEMVQV